MRFATLIVVSTLHVAIVEAACPNEQAYRQALARYQAQARDACAASGAGGVHCKGARDMVVVTQDALRRCMARSGGATGAAGVSASGDDAAAAAATAVEGFANTINALDELDDAEDAAVAAEQERRDAERRARQRASSDKLRKEEQLKARLRGLYDAIADESRPPTEAELEAMLKNVISDYHQAVGPSQAGKTLADRGRSAAIKKIERTPATSPAREDPGGCPSANDVLVIYTDPMERAPYPFPSEYTTGRLDSCPSVGGTQMTWCIPVETWAAHKAKHGAPPLRVLECWLFE